MSNFSTKLFLLGTLVFFPTMGCQSQVAEPQMSVKAPTFELTDLEGKKVSLASLKGKVVFLDFWATWCPPCVMSAPDVERLVEDYKDKDFEVLSISLDSDESTVRNFVSNHKTSSRVFVAAGSGVDNKYQVDGIPAFFIVDQQGNVTKAWQGYSRSMSALWRKEIDRLLEK